MSDEQKTGLIPVLPTEVSTEFAASTEAYEDLTKGGFLPTLRLYSKSKEVQKNLIPAGHWGFPAGDKVVAIGESVDLIPFARRPKAVDYSDKEAIITVYDPGSEEYARIREASGLKDSDCMVGISFLVYERSTAQFMEYYAVSKSAKIEAKNLFPFLPLSQGTIDAREAAGEDVSDLEAHPAFPATMRSSLVEGKFVYHKPVVEKCSTPFAKIPSVDKIVSEIQKFVNPPRPEVESAEDEKTSGKKSRKR